MTDWEPLAKQLTETLAAEGVLDDPLWRRAFQDTPRHLFVPRFWDMDDYNSPVTLIDGANPQQRQQWLTAAYTNRLLITQWSGEHDRRISTSSASQPSLVAHMLHLLDARPGQRVLEIGTGTGYNTALLCHRLGADHVSTIDIDPVLVAEARARLDQLAYNPTTTRGDGTAGLPENAPYHRILSTAATGTIPHAWIEQLTDDGIIVAPLTFGGALAVLHKTGPDQISGHLDREPAYFMPMHPAGQPTPTGFLIDIPPPGDHDHAYRTTTDIPTDAWANLDFRLWLALHLPETHHADMIDDTGNRTGVILYTTTGRATVDYGTGKPGAWHVTQDPTRLWNTVEAAWHAWQRHNQPDRARVGITATTDGIQYAWLDQPDSPTRWPL